MDDWRAAAACRGHDPGIWYAREPATDARRICAGCPVASHCLAAALRYETAAQTRFGIWGGTTPAHRQKISQLRQLRPT